MTGPAPMGRGGFGTAERLSAERSGATFDIKNRNVTLASGTVIPYNHDFTGSIGIGKTYPK